MKFHQDFLNHIFVGCFERKGGANGRKGGANGCKGGTYELERKGSAIDKSHFHLMHKWCLTITKIKGVIKNLVIVLRAIWYVVYIKVGKKKGIYEG